MSSEPILLTYRTAGAWGAGKGARLTAAEVDQNFHDIVQAIEGIEVAEPKEILAITVTGNQMTVHIDGGAEFGPFELPTAALDYVGDWTATTELVGGSLFTAANALWYVNRTHTTGSAFNPALVDGVGPVYKKVMPFPANTYDVGFFWPGKPGDGVVLGATFLAHATVRDFWLPADLVGSIATVETAFDADAAFPILKNGDEIGALAFAAADTAGTFTFDEDVQFASGDVLRITRNDADDVDATAAGLLVTLKGTYGLIPEEASE